MMGVLMMGMSTDLGGTHVEMRHMVRNWPKK